MRNEREKRSSKTRRRSQGNSITSGGAVGLSNSKDVKQQAAIYLQEQKATNYNQPMLGGVRSVGGGLHIGKKKVKRKTHQIEKEPLLLPPIPGVGKKNSPMARMVNTK